MVRRPVSETLENIRLRKPNWIPLELNPQEDWPNVLTLDAHWTPTLAMLHGYYNNQTQIVKVSTFGELLVAQGGSGLDDLDEDSGSQPSSFGAGNQITRSNGYKRVDVLVQGQDAQIRFTKLDGTNTAAITLPVGRYSFDFNCTTVQVKDNGVTGGTYQLLGYYSSNFIT